MSSRWSIWSRNSLLSVARRAALRWLERYLDEGAPTLSQLVRVTQELAGGMD
jgi:hypothetical protein